MLSSVKGSFTIDQTVRRPRCGNVDTTGTVICRRGLWVVWIVPMPTSRREGMAATDVAFILSGAINKRSEQELVLL